MKYSEIAIKKYSILKGWRDGNSWLKDSYNEKRTHLEKVAELFEVPPEVLNWILVLKKKELYFNEFDYKQGCSLAIIRFWCQHGDEGRIHKKCEEKWFIDPITNERLTSGQSAEKYIRDLNNP